MKGKLIGVGVGPGDTELLTLKAVRLIQTAPVLAYTIDANGNSYARKTIASYIPLDQKELPLSFSMSRNREDRLRSRREAARIVLAALAEGQDVVFITEGDPLLYSTFQHLLSEMPREIPVEVCPGVSALTAAASAAVFSLVVEDEVLIVAPAETGLENIHLWLTQGYTVVLFKVFRQIKMLKAEIRKLSFSCEAVLVERVSTAGEVITRQIDEWPEDGVPYFSIILLRPLFSLLKE